MAMCRACLSTEKALSIMNVALIYDFNLLTNLNITLSEEMPVFSCNTCLDAIKFCTEFREKCIASDLTFKEILMVPKQKEVKDELNIKLEYESDSNLCGDYYVDSYNDSANSSSMIETKEEEDFKPRRTGIRRKTSVNLETKKNLNKIMSDILHNNNLENCGICSKDFDGMVNLIKHLELHKLEKHCGLCSERFIDFAHMLAHRIEHIPKVQRKCHICAKKFKSTINLEFHYIKKHNLRGKEGLLLCKQCLRPYKSPIKLYSHIKSVHSEVKFNCNECGKGFGTKAKLRSHMRLHADEKRFLCDSCDYSSKYSSALTAHKIRRHIKGHINCKACGRAFATEETLDKHNCKQLLEVICPICGQYVRQLPRHMRTHTNKFMYKCERCPSQFKSAEGFRAHNNKHDGHRPHKCPYCAMSFYSQSVLIKHRRTHTGEKPYVCKICSKGFTGNNNLKVHMKVHGQYLVVKKNSSTDTPSVFG